MHLQSLALLKLLIHTKAAGIVLAHLLKAL
jgi:hypothetical protein